MKWKLKYNLLNADDAVKELIALGYEVMVKKGKKHKMKSWLIYIKVSL